MKKIILAAVVVALFSTISFAQAKKRKEVREKQRTHESFKKKEFSHDGKYAFKKDGKRDHQAKKFFKKHGKFSADKRKMYAKKKHDRYKKYHHFKHRHPRG